jgi:class 3 adenylate cyclase
LSLFTPASSDFIRVEIDGRKERILKTEVYNSFNPTILGLGDINRRSRPKDAISAMFDLEGFTNFSRQIEPHLSVPTFLSAFLEWLMAEIRKEMTMKQREQGVLLWCPLPFLVKFMGDGLLAIWDVKNEDDIGKRNIVVSCAMICDSYQENFLPRIRNRVVDPPPTLRCGLARGTVYSVGDGQDFVGSCINMAARLQKIDGATFVFNRRGFDLEASDAASFFKEDLVVKKMAVRGIGDNELVALRKQEYEAMTAEQKKQFGSP